MQSAELRMQNENAAGRAAPRFLLRSDFCIPRSALRRRAFTMMELLIVIGIVVLLLALSVPAFTWLTGSSSVAGAENTVSAMIGRARGDALGLQRDTGVLFFIDPASQRVALAEVTAISGGPVPLDPADAIEARLDLVPDRDFLYLPSGVSSQIIDNHAGADDRYIGFNTALDAGGPTILPFGGVILFDANGRLASRTYSFAATKADGATTSEINNLLFDVARGGTAAGADMVPSDTVGGYRSAFGFALFDRDQFLSNGALEDAQAGGAADIGGEETWIDENAVPLLINRFNGTLVRSE